MALVTNAMARLIIDGLISMTVARAGAKEADAPTLIAMTDRGRRRAARTDSATKERQPDSMEIGASYS